MQQQSILIVEDEPAVALMLARFAEKLGYQVIGRVATAGAAKKYALKFTPDIIFMDIKLKGTENGIDIARHLQAFYSFKLIYITGIIDKEIFNQAVQETPFTDFLLKPVSIFRLRESLLKTRPAMRPTA